MIRTCLLIPIYAQADAVERTMACIEAVGLSESQCRVYRYFEEDDAEIVGGPEELCFTKEYRAELEEEILTWEPEDVVLPVFAGDIFSAEALRMGLNALNGADHAAVYGTGAAYLNMIRIQSLDVQAMLDLLTQSCLTLADGFDRCILPETVSTKVVTDTELTGLCYDFHRIVFPEEKRRVWAFCAGHYSNDFRGNPKYLFLYLNRYRKDVGAYWLCDSEAIVAQVRYMGYHAFRLGSVGAELAIDRTGVLVAEQVKNAIPAGLEDAVYLNLWHGVGGIKAVERSLLEGRLAMEIAKKYIQHNAYYRKNEMYLAPSKFIEKIAKKQLAMEPHQIIRSGYPRNIYQRMYERAVTFDHDCFRNPDLPENVRFAAYIPTFRNVPKGDLFAAAIPDMEQLIQTCKKNNVCLIFKMHPLLESELSFQQAKAAYADCPWVYFWDNSNDFYEVLDQMDLCIFDYSSMFTDFIAAGCKHFLRYAFDFTGDDLDFPMDYDEATLGRKCGSFPELLEALGSYETDDLTGDIRRISDLYWMHAAPDSMDRIISAVLEFKPVEQELPTLYSFDIFDTLISRRVLAPEGIFYRVQERMRESNLKFPNYLVKRYPFIRKNAELNMREYYNRSKVERNDERCEIQFDQILKRIQTLYELTNEQTRMLGRWEIEAELEDVVPLEKPIARVKQLLAKRETVILISDMYLPGDVIRKMLAKADPVLAKLPLYLSSERGYQKSAKTLFMEVYRDFAPDYRFGKWIHTGDNLNSDVKNPRSLNIETIPAHRTDFNTYEAALAEALQSYDGYLIAASMARFREEHPAMHEQFAYSYISLLFVPYVRWAMNSSKAHGKKNVYLIARDGHQLKKIADVVNKTERLGLKTKYIYASRRVWRIPSFFDHIDVGFWGQGYGNMAKVNKFSKLLKALDMDEPTFRQMFPELQGLNEEKEISPDEIVRLSGIFKNSEKYLHYLLDRAEKQRIASCEYLKQEMNVNEPFSVIEYWGRGYTQENFTRLWQHVCGRKEPTTFYYSRSTLPSDEDNIRMNFTSHPSSQAFIESIFACINYKTIQSYRRVGNKWMPVTEQIMCNQSLFHAMEMYLPEFAANFCTLPMTDRDATGRNLIDFAISWYNEHPEWEGFTKVLAQLVDSVEMYGAKKAFANPLTTGDLNEIMDGTPRNQVSKNIAISYYRSDKNVQQRYCEMFQLRPGEDMNGGSKISDINIQRNRRAAQELSARKRTQARLQAAYDKAVREQPLQQKILLVNSGDGFSEQEYGSLMKALFEQNAYAVEIACPKTIRAEKMMERFAVSRVILTFAPIKQLSGIQLRPETRLVVMGDTPIRMFYAGLVRREPLRDVKELSDYNMTNDISVVHASSAVAAERARKIYSVGSRTRVLQTGSVITDCYFNAELRQSLREQLYEICPEAAGKKIIAYAPLHRYRNAVSKYAYLLDMQRMQKELGDEYFVIMHLMEGAKEMSNVAQIPGFSRDLSQELTPRVQMLVADVIVADYRDTTYEAPLAGVPTFVTCGDKRVINKRDSLFCPVEDMLFGVPVNNTEELIAQLRDLKNYDHSYRKRFISEYLTACDGRSAERVVASILKDEPEALVLPDLGTYSDEKLPEYQGQAPEVQVCMDLDNTTVVLHWEPVPGACGYEILAGEQPEMAYQWVGQSKVDSCVHRIRNSEDVEQWYCVRALYCGGTVLGPCSEPVLGSEVQKPGLRSEDSVSELKAPEIRWIVPTARGNRLYWTGDRQCAGWRVYCYHSDGEVRQVDHLQVNTWEWTDRDPAADQNAKYDIRALYWLPDGQLLEGPATSVKAVDRLAKAKAALAKYLRGKFVIKWKPDDSVTGYHLYCRSKVRGEYEHIADFGPDTLEYTVEGENPGPFSYILCEDSEEGMAVCRPVAAEMPDDMEKPSGLCVRHTSAGTCLLWNADAGVDKWTIRVRTKEDGTEKKVAEVSGHQNWWVDPEGSKSTHYRVEAVRRINGSNQFSGYCKAVSGAKAGRKADK